MSLHSEAELIEGLKAGGRQRRFFERELYRSFFYLIVHGSRKYGITEEDAASTYSDTVIVVIDHILQNRFEGRSALKSYVYQIFSNKCVDLLRKDTTNKQQVNHGLAIDEMILQLPDKAKNAVQQLIARDQWQQVMRCIQELGAKCREVLLYFEDGYSDREIAEMTGYHSAEVVKTSRLRCLDKLRKMMNLSKW
ncbi:sigma-70 family RNA polymerase sigma factor [Pedobacter sp. JY14-1]|uniref:RNA polymerase sigma factor n=1 Tax=Pedobacter sp. JY14-1 TaxID=3034151 RepID=UPI0023E1BBE6|nr:sigma-70 family RNA polymerase sigma factor [Pedobacter sp. JY14-1]